MHGSLQRGGSRKRTFKSLILEEVPGGERERGTETERGKIRALSNLCVDSCAVELRVSRVLSLSLSRSVTRSGYRDDSRYRNDT